MFTSFFWSLCVYLAIAMYLNLRRREPAKEVARPKPDAVLIANADLALAQARVKLSGYGKT